jgi:hypothetical protein
MCVSWTAHAARWRNKSSNVSDGPLGCDPLKVKAVHSSETLLPSHKSTRRHCPEDHCRHLYRRDTLKSRKHTEPVRFSFEKLMGRPGCRWAVKVCIGSGTGVCRERSYPAVHDPQIVVFSLSERFKTNNMIATLQSLNKLVVASSAV